VSGSFPKTHGSAVLAAGHEDGTAADTALAELCRGYWYPLYAFARRKGHQPADAQDLTQMFFVHLLEARLVRKADPHKGRFRSFLLGCFTLFLASETDRAQARKRGGGLVMVPIDVPQAERRLAAAPASTASPEELFDRHWAVTVLDTAPARLEAEMRDSGRGALFEHLLPSLQGDDDLPRYADIARRLETTEGTVKVTVHRLRRRYRELIRMIVSQTVHQLVDVDTELTHLMAALRG
jgi:RNA polymerase sigma-70 factor (ECF subfamily)